MKIGELITKGVRTGQLRLIDVLGAVTLVAILLATLTPLLRLVDRENLTLVLTPSAGLQVLVHFAGVMLALAYAIYRRMRLEKQAGRRFGVAFCAPAKWEHGPRMRCILTMIGLTCLPFIFILTEFRSQDSLKLALLHSAVLALLWSEVVVNFLWRAYPGTVEFFKSGIAVRQEFHPWTDIELRKSPQSDVGIRLVVSKKLTATPQVSKEFAAAIRDHHAEATATQIHPLDR